MFVKTPRALDFFFALLRMLGTAHIFLWHAALCLGNFWKLALHFFSPLIPLKPNDAAILAYMAHWNQSGVDSNTAKP